MQPTLRALTDRITPSGDSVADTASPLPKDVMARLRLGRLRMTGVRRAMLTEMSRQSTPITLRQLQAVTGSAPTAFATLYRCMLRFEQIGLVQRIIALDGLTRWELNLGRHRKFHVTCRSTGRVTELDHDASVELRRLCDKIEDRLRQIGYTQVQVNLSFHAGSHAEPHRQPVGLPQRRIA